MENNIGDVIDGFKISNKEFVQEADSNAIIYTHEKTKASVIYLQNEDKDKVFNIGFKTPPYDDSGVAHIIEHSVFCGSDKFPVKEPFLEIMKGSLNTFLNAMTYKDKTMYPFSSQNEEDYMNILDIYLDAVFNPSIDKTKEIFMQEGWHYELIEKNDNLSINGVVYNEMKGSLSSPTTLLNNEIYKALFDNLYKYVSGGDPKCIPNLTYEKFLEFYNKYYHPSNCCIYVYGNCNINVILKFINNKYLSNYTFKQDIPIYKPEIKNLKNKYISAPYTIDEHDLEENKTFIAKSYVISTSLDDEVSLAIRILSDILINSDAAPIKRALLKEHLCGNVFGMYDNTVLQPVFSIVVENTNKDNLERIEKIINDNLINLASNGINKKLIEACINTAEFSLREIGASGISKGLMLGINIITRWAYCNDDTNNPLDVLRYEKNIKTMKNWLENDGFEKSIKKYLFENEYTATITLYPEKGLSKKSEDEFNLKMLNIKNNLTDKEVLKIINENKALNLRQDTPDTEQQLNTIPLLKLKDINKKATILNIEEISIDNTTLLFHEAHTGGIVYMNLMFDTSMLDDDKLTYLGLLCHTLGSVETKNYTFEALSNEILINTGGISVNANAYADTQDTDKTYKYIEISVKAVKGKLNSAIDLVKEILLNTKFDDKQRLLEIIKNIISISQAMITSSGHQLAVTRLLSHISTGMIYREKSNSFTFFKNIKNILDNFDKKAEETYKELENLINILFCKENLTIGLTCNKDEKQLFLSASSDFIYSLPNNQPKNSKNQFTLNNTTEGFLTPSSVQYVALGYNFKKLNFTYDGSLEVLKTILSTDYLWNNIRIKGGAYGAMVILSPSGNLVFVSYRDPNLQNTLDVYKNIGKYIEKFEVNDREMTKFILGTVQVLDQPLFPQQAMRTAVVNYITHNTPEFAQKIRTEILTVTCEDIRNKFKLISSVIDENLFVVFGNSEKIKENKKLFDKIITVL
ncbi:insulinase family protein [Sedimentibacter sp. zth1]|uniref:insulinase family protein n=1 Tax=Sedimentibacter sp. zth1 TaxID=2816908 RepID=UPI001A92A127|nr:insulinase family protein [Sedimentibacter sp. zth1]QSX06303.1 insulinase family protein [Sedimentibacter sp. zth1]